MKRIYFIIIIAAFFADEIHAQEGWEKIILPDSLNMDRIYCLDETTLFGWPSVRFPEFIYKTDDGGKNWKIVFEPTIFKSFSAFHMSFVNPNIGFCTYALYLLKTVDAGNTWNKFSILHYFNYRKIVAIDEEYIWLLGTAGFQISSNGGKSFQPVAQYDKPYYAIEYSNGIGYAVDASSNVLTTTDKGKTWDFVSNLFSDEMHASMEHDLQIFDSDKAIFNGYTNIVRTEDGFQSILKHSPPNNHTIEKSIFSDFEHGMVIMLKGEERELYYTKDGGQEWTKEFGAEHQISDVAYKGNVWYAMGEGAIYKTIKPLHIPTEKNISIQIFPNPVTDFFIIQSGSSIVRKIEIYDATGRMVLSQDAPEKNMINVKSLASGMYIVKIDVENTISQVKIVKQ